MYKLVLLYKLERSFFSKLFSKNEFSLNLKSFNTPELSRDFLMDFSRYNELYFKAKLYDVEKDQWFDFNKHGFV